MEREELERILEAILFAAGEPVSAQRIAAAAQCEEEEVHEAARRRMDSLAFERRGIRILRLEDSYQMCSSPELVSYITTALETRKPPKLSASQLETLTIIAYYQPATKAYVEQIRGVDSAYTIGALVNKNLVEECGRLNVPGRPIQYRTTKDFLRTFGLSSLSELPEINRMQFGKAAEAAEEAAEIPSEAAGTPSNAAETLGEGTAPAESPREAAP